jgi:CubicO group peptidase (beta-lactamase class C family)
VIQQSSMRECSMTIVRKVSPIVLAAALILAGFGTGVQAAHLPGNAFDPMDALFQEALRSAPIPGGGYAIVENGKIVHIAAFGRAGPDGRAMTVQTPMFTGSVGKTITALGIHQLVLAGRLDLSAPVTRYLPWFTLATQGAAEAITVQNLLDHKSGLSTQDGQNLARIYQPGLTPEDVARGLKDIRPAAPPGAYAYSNLNYVLLGLVIEAASGQRYGDYLEQHIFTPLDMRHSSISYEEAKADGLASGYRYLFGFPSIYEEPFPTGMVPAGYHIASVEDMAHFLAALSNGGIYEGPHGPVSLLAPDGKPAAKKGYLAVHWEPLQNFHAGRVEGHSGANINANAAIQYVVSRRYGVVVMLNSNPYQAMNIARSAWDIGNDILNLYGGYDLRPRAPSTRTVYLYIDALLLVLLALVVFKAAGLSSWHRRYGRARTEGRRPAAWFLARSLAVELLLPLLFLLGIPVYMQATSSAPFVDAWPVLLLLLPDIGYTLLVVSASLLAIGLFKVWRSGSRNNEMEK